MIRLLKEIFSIIKTVIITVIIVFVINMFLIQWYRVEGASMNPTLETNDIVVIERYNDDYQYRDVVVVDSRVERPRTMMDDIVENPFYLLVTGTYEENKKQHNIWIKRVVGVAGDQLEIIDGLLYRNGELIDEPYILEKMQSYGYEQYSVNAGYIFVMGDNRNNSTDSRYIGCIPVDNVLGKVIFPQTNEEQGS